MQSPTVVGLAVTDRPVRVKVPTEPSELAAAGPDPSISVFINCPFDDDYSPVMDAIIFSTVCSGFLPRSALESGAIAVPRMERIARCVMSSRYSIHDLSRCVGEGEHNYGRFNMPLELGMAVARKISARTPDDDHDWMLLVPKGHSYQRFISDLAGYDAKPYEMTPESVIPAVMSWLATRPNAVPGPKPRQVIETLPKFTAAKEQLSIEWATDIPWSEIILAAREAIIV
jgi:hypothetical protein